MMSRRAEFRNAVFLAFDDDHIITSAERQRYYDIADGTFSPADEELDVLLGIARRFLPAGGDFLENDIPLLRALIGSSSPLTDDDFYAACEQTKSWINSRTDGRNYERAVEKLLHGATSNSCWMSHRHAKLAEPMHLGDKTGSVLKGCRENALNPYGLVLGTFGDCAEQDHRDEKVATIPKLKTYNRSEVMPVLIVKGGSASDTSQVLYQPQARWFLYPRGNHTDLPREQWDPYANSTGAFRCVFD